MVWVRVLRQVESLVCASREAFCTFRGVSVRRSNSRVSDKVGVYAEPQLISAAPLFQRLIDTMGTRISIVIAAARRALGSVLCREISRRPHEHSRQGTPFDLNQVCQRRDKVVMALRVELA